MKKKQTKKLLLTKETLNGLEKMVQGGTGWPYSFGCGGGGGNPSEGFVDNPDACPK